MRIVAGRFKGRPLAGPRTDAVRPTSDRLREAIFNVLAHGYDDACDGARVLDLFAGTGAMSLEAISRGAAFAVLVDDGAEARGLIRTNVDALGLGGLTRIFRRDASHMGATGTNGVFDLVFCDPPYGKELAPRALASAASHGWLTQNALVVVEEKAGANLVLPDGFSEIERRVYGDTQVIFARFGS
jgi:16S rRNA (guanine966-N2)-methyltransferase